MGRRSRGTDSRIFGPEAWAVIDGVELSHWDLWFLVVMHDLSGGKRELVRLLRGVRRYDGEEKLGADVRMRRFSSSLAPVTSEEILAGTAAQEGCVALAPFGSSWAVAWRTALAGTETISAKTIGASWSVTVASPGPAEDKPALAELDATHLLLVFSEGTPARLRGAILDTASQTVTPFPITPSVAPYSTDASLAQSHPNAVRAGSRLFVAWRSALVPGDPKAEGLWLKELDWTSSALDLSKTEVTLPRWPAHLKDDQRRPALAAMGSGALATAWDDYGRVFGSVEGTPDVVAELLPLPILRKNTQLDAGGQ